MSTLSSLSTTEIDRGAAIAGTIYAGIGVLAYSYSVYPDITIYHGLVTALLGSFGAVLAFASYAMALRWLVAKLPEVEQ